MATMSELSKVCCAMNPWTTVENRIKLIREQNEGDAGGRSLRQNRNSTHTGRMLNLLTLTSMLLLLPLRE